MNKNPVSLKINDLIFWVISLVSFLVPVFFLTTTYEYFEFNKFYLFVALTGVTAILWCAKMVTEKRVYVARSPMDFAVLLVLTSTILSTLTSLDKTASLFGSYGRWFPSLFGAITLTFFYYAASTNLDSAKKIRTILWSLVSGVSLTALLALANFAGLVLPFLKLFNQKGFLLSGSTTALSALLLPGCVMAAMFALSLKSPVKKVAMLVMFLFDFVALMIFGGALTAGVAAAAVALAVFKSPTENLVKSKLYLFPVLGAAVTFAALFFVVPQTKTLLQREFPRESSLSTAESWIASSTTLRDFPVFGSGVSTFYLNYPRYRTASQNYTPTWNVNFDKPANEIFNIISTLGIFGIVAYGALIVASVRTVVRSTKVNDPYKGLTLTISAGLLASTAWMFLSYASFQSTFLFFSLLSLLTAEAAINSNKAWSKLATISLESKFQSEETVLVENQIISKKEVFQYIVTIPTVALTLFGMYQAYLQYVPETYIKKSMTAMSKQDAVSAYDYQAKAVALNPSRSEYHRLYASTNLALAQSLSTKQDLTDQEKTTAQNLLAQALRNIKYATETVSPLDGTNWETRAQIYQFLMPAAKDADQFAVQAYNTAIQLNPTNPALRVALGGIYFGKEDYLSAGNLFKQAVNLKSDYANARYNLAHALFKLKAYADAKTELEAAQSLVDKDSQDYNKVAADLAELEKAAATVAGASTESKPSVESLEKAGSTGSKAPAVQEPLSKPGN